MPIDLKRITKGRIERAPRVLVYGFDGVGKTGFAAGAPAPFFLDANRGSHKYPVERVDVSNWLETFDWLEAIESDQIKCSTVVLDSISDFESMSHTHLFPGTTVTKYEGGYAKGDDLVSTEWRKLLFRLERLWEKGHPIVMVAHATVKKFEDPVGPGFERFEVACRKQLAGILRQWCDYVLFVREDVTLATEKNKPVKATTTGARWMHTRRVPAYDAKARGTTHFPERLPLSYVEFESAIKSDQGRSDDLMREINSMLAEIGEKALEAQVRDYLKKYPTQLVEAHNRVQARFEEKVSSESETQTQEGRTGT